MTPLIVPPLTAQALHAEQQLATFEQMTATEQEPILQEYLDRLAHHAVVHSPFWRRRIGTLPKAGLRLADLPILRRADLQENFADLRARPPQMAADKIATVRTSGSTGRPVEVERFLPTHRMLYQAMMLRDYHWHDRDARRPIAVIKDEPEGSLESWGPCFAHLGLRGKVHRANLISHDPDWLSTWLREKQPDYLSTTPTMALRLAEIAIADPVRRIPLREILTYGEVVTPELRRAAREAFGARVSDRYSCEEVGWIALQCPHGDHLHVLSLSTIVEIVDDQGRPCMPGQPGRVLLTNLQGYAMPLLRYEIGDLAEWGEPTGCGINLPVLLRVWGRSRSFVRRPDGSVRLARLTGDHWRRHAPIREYRVVQYADGLIEAFVVPERPLSPGEVSAMKAMLVEVFEYPFNIIITETARIDWVSRWKREDVMVVDWLRQAE